jgi:hypothetical protein
LVFVDESGSNLALAPRYGWAPKGQPAWGKAPTNRGKNTTVVAAMTPEGLLKSMTVEGPADTEAFLIYLEKFLCPALQPGKTVLMDNLRVHKAEAVRQRIEACGCQVVFLPRYSPDFNPLRPERKEARTSPPDLQGSEAKCRSRFAGPNPAASRCSYPSAPRGNPTCEASGTMSRLWQPQAGDGLGEVGKAERKQRTILKAREIQPAKGADRQGQNGKRVGSGQRG